MPGPVKKKKPFIDKKNAVSFHLVHRSQQDPLQADDEAPQRVLLPANVEEADRSRREEQKKFGVFYDDEYDYMQHLKDVNELREVEPVQHVPHKHQKEKKEPEISNEEDKVLQTKDAALQLPSSLFGSQLETKVGMLNKAAPLRGPQLDWDPDIVAALDEDFDFDNPENELDDDFIVKAMEEDTKKGVHFADDEKEKSDFGSDEADMSDYAGSYDGSEGDMFRDEETRSRFTAYSMTSSVIRRNEGLSLLDDRFEELYAQYDDDEIGALDQDEIKGFVEDGNAILSSALEEFEKKEERRKVKLKDVVLPAEDDYEEGSEPEEELELVETEAPKEKWDCESILSTYSTLYNHPSVIKEPKNHIKLTKRAGIPEGVLPSKGPTRKQLEQELNEDNKAVRDPVQTYRPHDETPEEKKARKAAVKEERKMRREEKKVNQKAFKAEKIRQDKDMINVKKAMSGVKIQ